MAGTRTSSAPSDVGAAGGPAGLAASSEPVRSVRQLVAELPGAQLVAAEPGRVDDPVITGVRQDSRTVEPGDLFVALAGARSDGARFVPAAAERGAVAVLHAAGRTFDAAGLPRIVVAEPRGALARAAALVYGQPTRDLSVVGITGTNGKTTTAHLVQHALGPSGARPAIAGTLGYRFGDLDQAATLTSPEADELQRLARAMVRRGATHLVMEVSSIALAAERVAEVDFDVAAFTNLTQDHLDYHGTMEAYAAAKEQLFFAARPAVAVVNVDDPHGRVLAERVAGVRRLRLLRYAAADPQAEVHGRSVRLGAAGIAMEVHTPSGSAPLHAPLVGAHNVSNLLCTAAIVEALGLELEPALAALATVPPVAGRLERCDDPGRDDVVAVVDYAHTPDALERVLGSMRSLTKKRIFCVFGCGGDRDRDKREPMGRAVARAADVAIVTNDNPRSEDPQVIAAAIVRGLRDGDVSYRVELDRGRAIEQALQQAAAGDVVLVAGKGHEPYQIIGPTKSSFDDRQQVEQALARRRARRQGGAR